MVTEREETSGLIMEKMTWRREDDLVYVQECEKIVLDRDKLKDIAITATALAELRIPAKKKNTCKMQITLFLDDEGLAFGNHISPTFTPMRIRASMQCSYCVVEGQYWILPKNLHISTRFTVERFKQRIISRKNTVCCCQYKKNLSIH